MLRNFYRVLVLLSHLLLHRLELSTLHLLWPQNLPQNILMRRKARMTTMNMSGRKAEDMKRNKIFLLLQLIPLQVLWVKLAEEVEINISRRRKNPGATVWIVKEVKKKQKWHLTNPASVFFTNIQVSLHSHYSCASETSPSCGQNSYFQLLFQMLIRT